MPEPELSEAEKRRIRGLQALTSSESLKELPRRPALPPRELSQAELLGRLRAENALLLDWMRRNRKTVMEFLDVAEEEDLALMYGAHRAAAFPRLGGPAAGQGPTVTAAALRPGWAERREPDRGAIGRQQELEAESGLNQKARRQYEDLMRALEQYRDRLPPEVDELDLEKPIEVPLLARIGPGARSMPRRA